nr:uncharacterized mitochondrial protein AtMg00810-like [Ipomoea batatas]
MSRSSTEREYRALASSAAEKIWVRNLLYKLGMVLSCSPLLYYDNMGATYVTKNPMFHSRMKHLALDYFLYVSVSWMALWVFIILARRTRNIAHCIYRTSVHQHKDRPQSDCSQSGLPFPKEGLVFWDYMGNLIKSQDRACVRARNQNSPRACRSGGGPGIRRLAYRDAPAAGVETRSETTEGILITVVFQVLAGTQGLFVAAMSSSCTGVLQAKVAEAISVRDQSGERRRLQHYDMFLEPPNAISVHSDHRRPTMDGEEQHHLREVPSNAASRHRIRDPHHVASRIHRGVFPCHVGALESSAIRDRSTTPDHPSEEISAIPSEL